MTENEKSLKAKVERLESQISELESAYKIKLSDERQKVKDELSYKLGNVLVRGTKSFSGILFLPWDLIKEYRKWNANQKNKVEISVIIPVYNGEKFLAQCFDSIKKQNIANIEVIFVDDGSTDNSVSVINEIIKENNYCKLIQQKNQHAGVARNAGLQVATGRYVHFFDCDDWLEPNAYRKALNLLENNSLDAVMFNYYNCNNETNEKRVATYFGNIKPKFKDRKLFVNDAREVLFKAAVVPWNKIYRREFLTENSISFDNLMVANDRGFYFKLLKSNPKIWITDVPLINYRVSNKSSLIGKERLNHFYCHFKSFDQIKDLFRFDSDFHIIIDQFLTDLRIFYEKASPEQKVEIKKQTFEYINKNLRYFSQMEIIKNKRSYQFFNMILGRKGIPIVFAVDDDYVKYLSVALVSLKRHANRSYKYDIFVFYSNLSEENKKKIRELSEDCFNISFYDVRPLAKNLNLYSRAHYSISMYYRIFIPKILYAYDKAVYLDSDILLTNDVSNLFFEDIGNYWLSGVTNLLNNDMKKYTKWKMNLEFPEYFNSGILVFNVRNWNDNKLVKKALDLVEQNPKLVCPDQDVLNMVCKGRVKYLDMKWNYAWQHIVLDSEISSEQRALIEKYKFEDVSIIHYTSGVKPWKLRNWKNPYGKIWWEYAKESNFYDSIVEDLSRFEKTNKFVLSDRA